MRGSTEKLHGRDAHGLQGIDFFVDLHGAQLRRKGCAGAPGHDDARHHAAHLAGHPQAQQIDAEDLRPKLAQLYGPHKGQDQANEKADEAGWVQGLYAAFLYEEGQIDPPEAGLAGHQPEAGEDGFADEAPSIAPAPCKLASTAVPMPASQESRSPPAPGAFTLGHGGGQRQEAADAFRQALLIDDDLPVCARLQHLAQQGQEPAAPGRQVLRLEGQPPHRGAGVELLIHLGDDGRAGMDRPVPYEVHR